MNKISSKQINFLIEVIFLIVVFLVPTIFDRRLGIVFSGTKVAFMRVLGLVLLSLWSIKLIIFRQHKFLRTILDWPAASFLLCTTIATLTSVHVYTSFVGFYGRYEGLTTWYLYGLFFFVATNFLSHFEQIKRICMLTLCAGTYMAVYSILQRHNLDPYMWGGVVTWQRVIGTIGQPNFLAAYSLMVLFIGLAFFLMDKGRESTKIDWYEQIFPLGYFCAIIIIFLVMIYNFDIQNVIPWYLCFVAMTTAALLFAFNYEKLHPLVFDVFLCINLLLNYICLLYTQSRGGYMGLFTGVVLFCLMAGRKWLLQKWKPALILSGLIVLVTLITMVQPQFSPFGRFADEISIKQEESAAESKLELKGAAGSRGETWKSAFGIIADNPFFGIGPEVLKMVFPRYETDLFRFKEAFHVKQDRCHNETFDVGVTKGLVTFFIYIWLLYLLFNIGIKNAKGLSGNAHVLNAGLLAAALAYLIQNQFSFGVVAITSLFWIIWAMVMNLSNKEETPEKEAQAGWQNIPWLSISMILVLVLVLSYYSFASFRGDILFKLGKTELQYGQLPQAAEHLEEALNLYPFDSSTISHLGITYLNLSRMPGQGPQNIEKAIAILKYGVKVDAYNADNLHMLSKIYLMFYAGGKNPNDLRTAEDYSKTALKVDPYYAESYDVLGFIAEQTGDINTAIKDYEQAVLINPNLSDVLAHLEAALLKANRPGEKQAFLEKLYDKYNDNQVVLEQLSRYYISIGSFQQAAKVSSRLMRIFPDNMSGAVLLAESQLYLGQSDKCFVLLQDVLLKDPKNVGAYVVMAKYYLQKNDRQKYMECIEQVLALDPSNAWAKSKK